MMWIGIIGGAWAAASIWCAWVALTRMQGESCLCGAHDLGGIAAQHTAGMIHEQWRCYPTRERVQS